MIIVEIDLDLIDEDKEQPRQHFDENANEDLIESIRTVGLLSPIKVYKTTNGRYKIIFGNRRYKAFKKLGFDKIPCILSDHDNELDVYFEQLTENIQRENFTPIEEALAFAKLLDSNGRWKISKKYLSSKLGKSEKYIANKLSLLVFGSEVRKIIHNGSEIIPGKLTEEQALTLKNLPVEYRDQIALKIANDQRSVKDVKRIAQLFINPERSNQLKEKLLNLPCQELVAISIESELYKEEKKPLTPHKLTVVDKHTPPTNDTSIEVSPLQEEINRLILKIPSFNPLPQELADSIYDMKINERIALQDSIRILIENLERHLNEWKSIGSNLEKTSNFKKEIKLIKSDFS